MKAGKVLITIMGVTEHPDGTREENKVSAPATREILGDGSSRYVYEEKDVPGTVNEVLVEGGKITVTKRGAYSSSMTFETGGEEKVIYRTPFGEITMETATKKVAALYVGDNLHAVIQYRLKMDGDYEEDCKVIIKTEVI